MSAFSDAQSPGASFNAGPISRDILSLTPNSEVVFEVNAATNSLVAKVKIANTSAKIVVFKVWTGVFFGTFLASTNSPKI